MGTQVETQFNSQNKIQTCIKLGGRTKCYTYLRAPDACAQWRRGGRDVNAVCQLNHAASGCSPGGFLLNIRHTATMYTLAALGWSIWATGAVQHHSLRHWHDWQLSIRLRRKRELLLRY